MKVTITIEGEEIGPLKLATARELMEIGELSRDSMVKPENTRTWIPISDINLDDNSTDSVVETDEGDSSESRFKKAGLLAVFRRYRLLWIGGATLVAVIGVVSIFTKPFKTKSPRSNETKAQKTNPSGTPKPWFRAPEGSSTNSSFDSANRQAVAQYFRALDIAMRVNPSGDGQDAATNFLAAIDNVNWSGCSPELRNAAQSLAGMKNGDSMTLLKSRLAAFLNIANQYRR